MNIGSVPVVKHDERGFIYRTGSVNYISRKKGTVSANHTHPEPETIFLVEGKGELTVGHEKQIIEAPVKVTIRAHEYHKLVALTDIRLIRA